MTKDCGSWFLVELQKLVDKFKDLDLPAISRLKWRDHHTVVSVEVLENIGENFVGIEICPNSGCGQSTWICISAFINGCGWRLFAYSLGGAMDQILDWWRDSL